MSTLNGKKRSSGFTLVELILVAGIFAVIVLAGSGILFFIFKVKSRANTASWMELRRSEILQSLKNNKAWANTVAANPDMNCLMDSSITCKNLISYDATGKPIINFMRFTLVDANGDVILQPTDTSGFKNNGQPCNSFSTTSPNDDCPIRITLGWFPMCKNDCLKPEAQVFIRFVYAAENPDPTIVSDKYSTKIYRRAGGITGAEACEVFQESPHNPGDPFKNAVCGLMSCGPGEVLVGFDQADNAPICEIFQINVACPPGKILLGIDPNGMPICSECEN